jgi:cell division protein FtsB
MSRSRNTDAAPRGPLLTPERVGRVGAQLLGAGMLVLSLWMLASFIGQLMTSAQLDRRQEQAIADNARIEAENQALRDAVAYAESAANAETIAREQLGYAREGDVVILPTFPDITPAPAAAPPPAIPTPAPRANWRGWVEALFSAPAAP